MLKTLEKYNKKDAQRVLAHVAELYLPDPGISDTGPCVVDEASSQVIAELRARYGILAEDNSSAAQSKILTAITDEISESVLSGTSVSGIKARLARQGDLPSYLYDVKFSKNYASFRQTGNQDQEVLSAIREHDRYQHFTPPSKGSNLRSISLYLKNEKDYSLLVLTTMGHRHQEVNECWRVFRDDVDLTNITEPLEALKMFLDKFGVDFTLGEDNLQKLLIFTEITSRKKTELHIQREPGMEYEAFFVISNRVDDTMMVALFYVVDLTCYVDRLQKHGFALEWKPTGRSFASPLYEI